MIHLYVEITNININIPNSVLFFFVFCSKMHWPKIITILYHYFLCVVFLFLMFSVVFHLTIEWLSHTKRSRWNNSLLVYFLWTHQKTDIWNISSVEQELNMFCYVSHFNSLPFCVFNFCELRFHFKCASC